MVAERVRKIRTDKGLSQAEFGRKLGITRSSVFKIESGENNPSTQTIKLICQEFAISYDWLVNGVEPMYLPKEEAANWKLERLMQGDNEFVKAVFRELADLSADAWEELEAVIKRLAAEKKPPAGGD